VERLDGENRALKAQVQAVQHALLGQGPLMGFLLAYDRLDEASDPLMGRQISGGSSPHPFDRPMPHISTSRARELQRLVDRAVGPLVDAISDFFNEDRLPRGVCLACGGVADRSGRPPSRRLLAERFLRDNLSAPVRAAHMFAAAVSHGISRQTLLRAAESVGVVRFDEGGERWWRLQDSAGFCEDCSVPCSEGHLCFCCRESGQVEHARRGSD
jgi:hypothetical protein